MAIGTGLGWGGAFDCDERAGLADEVLLVGLDLWAAVLRVFLALADVDFGEDALSDFVLGEAAPLVEEDLVSLCAIDRGENNFL